MRYNKQVTSVIACDYCREEASREQTISSSVNKQSTYGVEKYCLTFWKVLYLSQQ